MSRAGAMQTWFFHRGALGDSVLLWPRLRTELRTGRGVALVTDAEKARLAAAELGVTGIDAESRRFNDLWREGAAISEVTGAARVVCAGGGGDPAGEWGVNIQRMFPGAVLEVIGRPSRAMYNGVDAAAAVSLRENAGRDVVVHVGAGSDQKRWPIAGWAEVVAALRHDSTVHGAAMKRRRGVDVIAGEVEQERLGPGERTLFEKMGGRFVGSLQELASTVRAARVFLGCDSGPAHLAAALGVRTVALFGPSDPRVWAPIGPAVRVVAPDSPRAIDWLAPMRVMEEAAPLM